jgi:hypothetical protein
MASFLHGVSCPCRFLVLSRTQHTIANVTHANCVCLCDLRRNQFVTLIHVFRHSCSGMCRPSLHVAWRCTRACRYARKQQPLTQQCIQSCCGQLSPQHTLQRREPCLSALKPQHRQQEQGSLLPATGSDAYATARPVVCSSSSCDPQPLVGGDAVRSLSKKVNGLD